MSQTADIRCGNRQGFTLVEMIVAMAIFTIIMGGVMVMFNSVTTSVRRGYRTMDTMDATHGALLTIERDVQNAFSAPATGADFHFYGEPYGFVFIGIAPDGKLGRLTYAVHVDTSRMTAPESTSRRGEIMTVSVERAAMDDGLGGGLFGPDFTNIYYPGTDPYVDVEVEVIYGVLLRYFEPNVNEVTRFPELEDFAANSAPPQLPFPNLLKNVVSGEAYAYRSNGLPWIFNDYSTALNFWAHSNVSVPWHIKEKVAVLEKCHYWMQMLNGPRIMPAGTGTFGWDSPYAIWYVEDVVDQFWYDHFVSGTGGFNPSMDVRHFLWDYVVARDFAINAWLIDPNTGFPVNYETNAVPIAPVFKYSVESGLSSGEKETNFNTLFNLNFDTNNDKIGAFDTLTAARASDPPNATSMDVALEEIVAARQFYDLGDPLQSRLPSAFEINLTVINPPVTTSAKTDLFQFSQTVHLPSGFRRRDQAVSN